jgi:hypothetical protein
VEEVARARAGEDGDAVRRGAHVLQVLRDALGVAVEALALWRVRLVSLGALRELLADEAVEVGLPRVVGLRVQVQTDDGKVRRLESRQAFNQLVQ